jgi:hypothetical protein
MKPIDIRKNKYFTNILKENVKITEKHPELQCDIHNIEIMFKMLDEMLINYRTLPCSEQPKNVKSHIRKLESQIKKSTKMLDKNLKALRKIYKDIYV